MKDLTDNAGGCCSSPSGPDKKTPQPQGFSSSGVNLIPSMVEATGNCCPDDESKDPIVSCKRPGYTICHYVDEFADTPAGPVPAR